MNKITEIITAWAKTIYHTEEEKQVAEERLSTCMRCEFWSENALNVYYCKKCGCPTKSKVFSPSGAEGCPAKKWKR